MDGEDFAKILGRMWSYGLEIELEVDAHGVSASVHSDLWTIMIR